MGQFKRVDLMVEEEGFGQADREDKRFPIIRFTLRHEQGEALALEREYEVGIHDDAVGGLVDVHPGRHVDGDGQVVLFIGPLGHF